MQNNYTGGKSNLLAMMWFRSSLAMALSLRAAELERESEEHRATERNALGGRELSHGVSDDPYATNVDPQSVDRREAQIRVDQNDNEGEQIMKLLNLSGPFVNPSLQKLSETPQTWQPTWAMRVARNNRIKGTNRRPRA